MAYPSPAGWNPAMGSGSCGAYPTPGAAYPQMCYPQSAATKPTLNPSIPFLGQIPGRLSPGKMVIIHGTIPPKADRFGINFQIGTSIKPRADIAFHLAIRVKLGHIVRNTLTNDKWGAEESGVPYQPFIHGQNFEIMILADKDEFKVAVNSQHYITYKHRVRPLTKIDYLGIIGDVIITSVKFQDEQVAAGGTCVSAAPIVPIVNPSIPFLGHIPGCLSPGKMVIIYGTIPPKADRFGINFQIGTSTKPRADIAFHLAIRVKLGHIVRNTLTNDKWGAEENGVPYQPFAHGHNFEIMILADKDEFKVAVNGQHYITYKHRVRPLKKIDYLGIIGDVIITSVKFQDEQLQ
ncbi:galectin-8-like [Saccoglossus kowalevskii]|uniref:Galectin n=1 Tax=Saccoglossus kowalevskii TaxID=10224 RepID=A0ABM0GK24_SACKO|nr:PREDICTED: galectin-8-like [Saccoglossus kowalevskii]